MTYGIRTLREKNNFINQHADDMETFHLDANIQGYFLVVMFIQFEPEDDYNIYKINLKDLRDTIGKVELMPWLSTRRLQKGELPYPGYCRRPGSYECLPILCNCDKLIEKWRQSKLSESQNKEGAVLSI